MEPSSLELSKDDAGRSLFRFCFIRSAPSRMLSSLLLPEDSRPPVPWEAKLISELVLALISGSWLKVEDVVSTLCLVNCTRQSLTGTPSTFFSAICIAEDLRSKRGL